MNLGQKLVSRFKNHETPDIIKSSYYSSIDGFRAIAILIVVFGHATNMFSGHLGVSFFFVISGFLITTLLLKEYKKNGIIDLKKFYIRRAFRILPLAYLYLTVLFVLSFIFSFSVPLESYLSCLFFIRNTSILIDTGVEGWTGHFWSLSVEEQFYIFIPALLILTIRRLDIFLYILILLFCWAHVSNFIYSKNLLSWEYSQIVSELFRNISGIVIGSGAAVLTYTGILKTSILGKYSTFLSIVLFCLATLIQAKFIPLIPMSISEILMAIILVGNLNSKDSILFRFLNHWIIVKIGVLSYSLYIWQQLFTVTIPWKGLFMYSDSIILNLIGLFIVSYLSYFYYEKKFLKLKLKHAV
jgi:peptidoglycan/LPS O-acetylase OafA/YrhL